LNIGELTERLLTIKWLGSGPYLAGN